MATAPIGSKERFSSRVETYIKYRPSYPREVIDTLVADCGLTPSSIVADIGSGTGILTELVLQTGSQVFAVEPNRDMREAGERLLSRYPGFRSVAGSAEHTTLPDRAVEIVLAGQSFHWFDRDQAGMEFRRILKAEGWVAIVWNARDTHATSFLIQYERFLHEYGIDYAKLNHENVTDDVLARFFGPGGFRRVDFHNRQEFDFAGLKGRTLSSSFVPEAGHPRYVEMLDELARLFQANQADGHVAFEYHTRMYIGRL